jgi:hypothetical protein
VFTHASEYLNVKKLDTNCVLIWHKLKEIFKNDWSPESAFRACSEDEDYEKQVKILEGGLRLHGEEVPAR